MRAGIRRLSATRAPALLFLVVVALLGACGGGDDSPTTTTTSPPAAEPSAPVETSTETTIAPAAVPRAARFAGEVLHRAWLADDRAAARGLASPEAVDQLFRIPREGAAQQVRQCDQVGTEEFSCQWDVQGGVAVVTLAREGDRFRAQRAAFVAD